MGKRKRPKDLKPKVKPDGDHAAGHLLFWFNHKENDIFVEGGIPKPDQALGFTMLTGPRWLPPGLLDPTSGGFGPSFMEELIQRGYDTTTIQFSIQRRQHPWIKPGARLYSTNTGSEHIVHHVRWNGTSSASAEVVFTRPNTKDPFSSKPEAFGERMGFRHVEQFFSPTPPTPSTFLHAGAGI